MISSSLPQDPSRAGTTTGACVILGSAAVLATESSEGEECQRPPHLHRPCLCIGQKQHFISLPAIFKALLTQPPHSSGDSKETCLKPEAVSSASWREGVPGLGKDKRLWKEIVSASATAATLAFFKEFISLPVLYYQLDDSWISLRPFLLFHPKITHQTLQ